MLQVGQDKPPMTFLCHHLPSRLTALQVTCFRADDTSNDMQEFFSYKAI